jgi:glycine/D-amino acid oxidase-like deaminating enzyme
LKQQHVEFLVLGAGLQGSAIALELARRGKAVTLVDQDSMPMNRASLRNEGKIHLGLIYAADTTLKTALLQLRGALNFYPLLRRWLGPAVGSIGISTPFTYLVARDSVMNADALAAHYAQVGTAYHEFIRQDPTLDYLGAAPDILAARTSVDGLKLFFNHTEIAATFATEERAINTDDLAQVIRAAIQAEENITFFPNLQINSIQRSNGKIRVGGCSTVKNTAQWIDAEQVVNTTWEQRFSLDQMAGLPPPKGWLHRLKYRVIVQLPQDCQLHPSATMVLGRYGDVVVRPDASAYLSWYPVGLQGWSHELTPPPEWALACQGKVPLDTAAAISAETIRHISAWCPKMREGEVLQVDAGAILAYGNTDVDDEKSGLHDRTQIGISGDRAYMSVDPGKLTTAPMFASAAVDRLLEARECDVHSED